MVNLLMIPFEYVSYCQLQHFNFGDQRLNARGQYSLEKIFLRGSHLSFPTIFSQYAELKAFYRMMNNSKVNPESIHAGANAGLVSYLKSDHYSGEDAYLFNYTDTTFGKYHDRQLKLGYLELPTDNAIVIHSGVLTTSAYIPLGISHQEFILRDFADYGKSKQRQSRPFTEKESFKWVKGFDWAKEFSSVVNIPVVNVMDREADSADVFNYAFSQEQFFIARSKSNRIIVGQDELLWDHLKSLPVGFEVTRNLVDRKGKQHAVMCTIRYAKVELNGLQSKLWAILLQANDPSVELQETQWVLLSNLELEHTDMVIRVIDAYTHRWRSSEDLHKCLKSGCGIEKRQFRSQEALLNNIALLSICAARLLRMRHLAEVHPEAPLKKVLEEEEIQLAKALAKQYLKPADLKHCQKDTALWWILLVARLGGHQGYKTKGLPGWQTIYRGYTFFQNMLEGIKISKNFDDST